MVNTRFNQRKYAQRLVGCILFFLFSVLLHATEYAVMELSSSKVVRGENVTIRIQTKLPWSNNIQINRPKLNGAMVWWSYPYARPWSTKDENGEIVRMIEVMAAIRVDGTGFHSMDPFRIQASGVEVVTESAHIIGLESDESHLPYPVVAQWRSVPDEIWQGQSIPVILEARNLPSLSIADSVTLNQTPAGLLEEAPGYGGVVSRTYNNAVIYDVALAGWIWTHAQAGEYLFPGIRVSFDGLIRENAGFRIRVRELPESVQASGAVGRFHLSVLWDDIRYRTGDILSVRVRVDGSGNLSVLKGPIPELKGAELISSSYSSSYLPSELGYEGWREERFDFRLNANGKLSLNIPDWICFDAQGDGQIYRIAGSMYSIDVDPTSFDPSHDSASRLLGKELFRYGPTKFHGENPWWYLLAIPGCVLAVVLILVYRPKWQILMGSAVLMLLSSAANTQINDIDAIAAKDAALNGNWDNAQSLYDGLEKVYGELPGLLHDRSIVAMEMGHVARSVALMRRAIFLRPGDRIFGQSLRFIEKRLGLTHQANAPLPWSPSTVFILWVIAVNGMFLAFLKLIFSRSVRHSIIAVSMIFLVLITSTGLIFTHTKWARDTAVVSEKSRTLRKVPGPLATDWIQLPAGSTVTVITVQKEDYLVRTGYGLEGWLPLKSLLFINEEIQ